MNSELFTTLGSPVEDAVATLWYVVHLSLQRTGIDVHMPAQAKDSLMQQWLEHRDEFLDALLWLDGRGGSLVQPGCPNCNSPGISGTYRCEDCFGLDLVCKTCCLERHKLLPLHRVKVWKQR
jgi:hypothetical protein